MPVVVTDDQGNTQEICPAACYDGLFDPDNMSQEEIDRICNLFECGPLDIEALATALFLMCSQLNAFCDPQRDLMTGDVVHICSNDETFGVTYRGPKRPAWYAVGSDYYSGSQTIIANSMFLNDQYNPDGYLSFSSSKITFNTSGFAVISHQPGLESEGGFFTADLKLSTGVSGSTVPNTHITLPPQQGARQLTVDANSYRIASGAELTFEIWSPMASTSKTCGESTILFFPDR